MSGGIGKGSIIDTSCHPPRVKKLNFEFEGWLGDELIETFPCFIASENLKNKISQKRLTGFEFDKVEITRTDFFNEIYENKNLPRFYWLKVTGKAGQHDFGITDDSRLVVSANALLVIKETRITQAIIKVYQ